MRRLFTLVLRSWLAVSLVTAIGACSDDEASSPGTPPAISALTYNPDTATVGQATTINGSAAFNDQDGDVRQLAVEIQQPDGATFSIPPTTLQGTSGATLGTISFIFQVVPVVTGQHTFEIWVIDAAGNQSNRLSGTVDVTN